MAKIKTKSYIIDGEKIHVNFNCSATGLFSANISAKLSARLGLDKRYSSKSLAEIEEIVDSSFDAFIKSNTVYTLHIGINFGVSGKFLTGLDDKFKIDQYHISHRTMLGIDYRVIIKEHRNGNTSYWNTGFFGDSTEGLMSWNVLVEGYLKKNQIFSLDNKEILIPYTHESIKSLSLITEQLKSASTFIAELLSTDDVSASLRSTTSSIQKENILLT